MVGRATLAALLVAAAPSLADDNPVPSALRHFGLLGTWAMDCARGASPSDEYSIYAVSASGGATLSYRRGEPYPDIVYQIRAAEQVAPNRLSLEVLHMPDRTPVQLVLLKELGSLRVWSSHTPDGRMLVMDGVITGNGTESPRFKRCGP